MNNIKRAIKFTGEVAQRYNLKPPFSEVSVGGGGLLNNGESDLYIDISALRNFLDPLGKVLENESMETRDLVTGFLRLVNYIQQNPGQQISEDWIMRVASDRLDRCIQQ
jgi:hypothetical protein